MPPTLRNGKICYIQIPTTDIARSADFYKRVFGWNVRIRVDGSLAFDDGVQRSERGVGGRPPSRCPAGTARLHHGGQRGGCNGTGRR
jgi:predicted enzyme related to lactoylglutathione lyase